MAASKDLVFTQGKTFTLALRWETIPIIYKPITGITATAPVRLTVVSHGCPDGWRAAVTGVKGMSEINGEANKLKDTDYHMIVGSGYVWGEAYDYAMCILEEMQWIKTKSIHAAEFFHGTLELVEADTSIMLFYGEDETRPLMDRVYNFASKVSKEISIFDSKDIELPLKPEHRKFVSPLVIYAITERLSCHIERVRNHAA